MGLEKAVGEGLGLGLRDASGSGEAGIEATMTLTVNSVMSSIMLFWGKETAPPSTY
jgi:hypothetical protein